ncbi:MAG: hypothetical protein M3Y93_06535 [Pseudomonadota bacterium]|nr:hypothetical protein [Pseudomonadota bacterium]
MRTTPQKLVAMVLYLVLAPASAATALQPVAAVGVKPADAGVKTAVSAAAPRTGDLAIPRSKKEVNDFGPRADASTLSAMSGGTDVHQQTTLNGTVSDNHNDHVSTGYNDISSGAFNGASGVSTVIQNSGNSVLIQNATIINVQFKP